MNFSFFNKFVHDNLLVTQVVEVSGALMLEMFAFLLHACVM